MKISAISVIVVCTILSSCTLVDIRSEVSYDYLANPITDELLSQITIGKTSQSWVDDSIGLPTSKGKRADGSMLYTYNIVEHRKSYTHVLFVFRHRVDEVIPRYLMVGFDKGIVTSLASDFLSVPESYEKSAKEKLSQKNDSADDEHKRIEIAETEKTHHFEQYKQDMQRGLAAESQFAEAAPVVAEPVVPNVPIASPSTPVTPSPVGSSEPISTELNKPASKPTVTADEQISVSVDSE